MNKIRKIITLALCLLMGYGLLANVFHFFAIRQGLSYSFDDSIEMKSIQKLTTSIDEDTEKVKSIENSSLEEDVLKSYTSFLEKANNKIKENVFTHYEGTTNLTQKDIYQMIYASGEINDMTLLNMYKKLETVNSSLSSSEQEITQKIYTNTLMNNYIYDDIVNNYIYTASVHYNKYTISTILSLYQDKLNMIHYINELVLATERGGESE
ncbi:MAG: hypothetical protein MR388_04740 [Tenericutes bacterium]|nr:hypothetical protein [Mycoplasmatota bacterium]